VPLSGVHWAMLWCFDVEVPEVSRAGLFSTRTLCDWHASKVPAACVRHTVRPWPRWAHEGAALDQGAECMA
jgi:hypothetical protein